MTLTLPERVAAAALECFNILPERCKPRTHPDGKREWTPMSAVVLAQGDQVACVSLATGTKCLSNSALAKCQGSVIHDSHAEILALRGFNRWLLNEMRLVSREPTRPSTILGRSSLGAYVVGDGQPFHPPFVLREDVSIHMFTTEAPCGDASMELLISSKRPEDAIPWPAHDESKATDASTLMLGRGQFSQLGRVRRKPARADAEVSLSKSCTDKLTVKQYTGLPSFPVDLLVQHTKNIFLKSLIIYPDQFNETGYTRAFTEDGRLFSNTVNLVQRFDIRILPETFPRFEFEKVRNAVVPGKVSNLSVMWIAGHEGRANATTEVLINGVKQGFKQFDEREGKESAVCRKQMWYSAQKIVDNLTVSRANVSATTDSATSDCVQTTIIETLSSSTYGSAKSSSLRATRRGLKDSAIQQLGSWPSNSGDEEWTLIR